MKKKRKKKVEGETNEVKLDGVAKTEDTKPEDSKAGGSTEPEVVKPVYGEVLDNFKKSGDLMLLALDRKSGNAQVVITPNAVGDLHEAYHYLVSRWDALSRDLMQYHNIFLVPGQSWWARPSESVEEDQH